MKFTAKLEKNNIMVQQLDEQFQAGVCSRISGRYRQYHTFFSSEGLKIFFFISVSYLNQTFMFNIAVVRLSCTFYIWP